MRLVRTTMIAALALGAAPSVLGCSDDDDAGGIFAGSGQTSGDRAEGGEGADSPGFGGSEPGGLFQGCNGSDPDVEEEFIAADRGIDIYNYITAGTLEEALHCSSTAAAELAKAPDVYGADLVDYQENL